MMIIILMLPLLLGNFVQKWFLPQGIDWGASRIVIGDTDRDGNHELIFSTYGGSYTIYFYELHLPDVWEIDSVSDLDQPLLWEIGDFDVDGFYDLVMQSSWGPPSVGLSIYESPDSFTYPSHEVWRDTAGPPLVLPISAHDIDQDGIPEIVKDIVSPSYYLGLYEAIADNHYELIFTDNPDTSQYDAPSSTHAFGDIDGDSKTEFVMGGTGSSSTGAPFWVYECIDDNSYEKVFEDYVSTLNIRDCFSVPDADGDGRLEFVVKGYVIPSAEIHAFIFEATADNTYDTIRTFTLPGGDYYGGYSGVGDVDGDSIPEIALEGRQNIYIIKAAGNDSFYVWETLPGNNSGSSVRVYDVDNNGLSEVIISGNNQTRIYEYQVGIAEVTGYEVQDVSLAVFPNPFTNKLSITYELRDMSSIQAIEVRIYDACGRLVKDFAQSISSQYNQITWDGKDLLGRKLPGGVYFLKFQAGDYYTTEKVLLIR